MSGLRKTKIITDSGCDISKEHERFFEIDIMPFNIIIDNKEYLDRVDFTPQEFYDLANNSVSIPKTSQITVQRFEEKFSDYAKAGYENIICVLINSTGSKTYENAVTAKENLIKTREIEKTNLYILDSRTYSIGYGYPIVEAAKKLNSGQSVSDVIEYMEDWFNCLEIYIIGFDLRHMKKSGRINAAAAFLGELMGLKPVISLIDGESSVIKKSRGERAAIEDAVSYIIPRAVPETPWQVLRTTVSELEDVFIKLYSKKFGKPPSLEGYPGGVVTSNAGTKFIGVLVKGKSRRS